MRVRLTDMRQTLLAQMIEMKLGVDLRTYVITARHRGDDWRSIARDLTDRTGTSVSYEAVRSWFSDEASQASA